jgi:hypothetical protein
MAMQWSLCSLVQVTQFVEGYRVCHYHCLIKQTVRPPLVSYTSLNLKAIALHCTEISFLFLFYQCASLVALSYTIIGLLTTIATLLPHHPPSSTCYTGTPFTSLINIVSPIPQWPPLCNLFNLGNPTDLQEDQSTNHTLQSSKQSKTLRTKSSMLNTSHI